jgi:hypothetical protein
MKVMSTRAATGFAVLLLSIALSCLAVAATTPKKKKPAPPPKVKKADPVLSAVPKPPKPSSRGNTPGFSFNTAKEGTVEEFARGEPLADRRERFLTMILKKYSKSGVGQLTAEEEQKFLQDFNARQMLIVQRYDLDRNDVLGERDSKWLNGSLYNRRLNFFRGFDANNDGRLDLAETAAMRKELDSRRAWFEDNFDRF